MTAQNQPTWKPQPVEVGTERVLLLAVIPPMSQAGQDEHKHARAAFLELTKLLGVKRNIDFPSVTYTRNAPLVPDVLPDDLQKILGVSASTPAGALKAQFGTLVNTFGKINDCKAPAAMLTP
jgi:hypothetical protein